MSSSLNQVSEIIAHFIIRQWNVQRHVKQASTDGCRPLIVALQGPQGAGKSTLAGLVQHALVNNGLRTVVTSLDDYYMTHGELEELARSFPDNKLVHGRGQPGTHDTDLLSSVLERIKGINSNSALHCSSKTQSAEYEQVIINLPIFDKSLFNGQGDRSSAVVEVTGPIDVVIFEGWCVGFQPLSTEQLHSTYDKMVHHGENSGLPSQSNLSADSLSSPASYQPHFSAYPLAALQQINTALSSLNAIVTRHSDAFIAIRPESFAYVYQWRKEQEHAMKSRNGGIGMTDHELESFIDGYMPAYELFATDDGYDKAWEIWKNRGLELRYGSHRDLVGYRSL